MPKQYINIPASNGKATDTAAPKSTDAVQTSLNKHVAISPPNFGYGVVRIYGTDGPLVIHRFSHKTKQEMADKMAQGSTSNNRKKREAKDFQVEFESARYRLKDGSDGFHAAAIRNAMISACRLCGYKMTLAKMSLFVQADGFDVNEPQIPLVRIHGNPVMQQDMARVETGQPYVTTRAAYHDWWADVKLRWDADQFRIEDVMNLLTRVGLQVGICEGRYDSKNSAGMGWGCFNIEAQTAPGKTKSAGA